MENDPVQPPVQNVPPVTQPVIPSAPEPKHKIPRWFRFLAPAVVILVALIISAGAYVLSKNSATKTPSPQTVTVPRPSPAPNPIANWKTYAFTDYSLKLPTEFNQNDQGVGTDHAFYNYDLSKAPGRGFSPTLDKGMLKIEISTSSSNDSLKGYTNNSISQSPPNNVLERTNITLDGQKAIEVSYANKTFVVFTKIPLTSTILSIAFLLDFNNYQTLLHQFLSTFKFADQTAQTITTPTPSCRPRPACLDAKPRCMILETADMCPPTVIPSP